LIWRVGDDLFYASIGRIEAVLKNALAEVRPQVKHVLLDMSSVSYIDVSACDELITFIKKLKSRGVTIAFARVRDAVRENLQLSKIEAVVSPADFHERVTDGISAWQRREVSHGIPSSLGPDQLKMLVVAGPGGGPVLQFTIGRELPFTLKPLGASGRRNPRPRYRRCRSDNRDTKGPRRIWAG
jgi:anti-anti-sigma factor